MARVPRIKKLESTRLASTYGGWIYCGECGQSIGYLCYVTYDHFRFAYKCKCGSRGSIRIDFEQENQNIYSDKKLITIKNRLCCPEDQSPLFTVLEKNLDSYNYEIECVKCKTKYAEEKTL
ncbi:hypothetical protein [Diplocloster agilis]|uniref:Uncharacterized protein n=1 Tax=Diplocloster agilis TaxID=2850323 RepID=A0A949K0R9_9FIRM|nr:hypothetical protein [Diplocloster agilis]MBU9736630.1 hypothetical protein [Diplocloster agilis]